MGYNPQTVSFRTQTSERLRLSTVTLLGNNNHLKFTILVKWMEKLQKQSKENKKVHPTWNSKYKHLK